MTRTHRFFQLMQALRNAPPPATATSLARTLSVTPRTIYRDIDALRGLGAVIDGAAGFGYTLIEDAALPPLSFADDELEARGTTCSADPLSLVYMQASLCLLVYCHLREDFRVFRLDLMRNLDVTEASFRPRRVPMLRDCLAQMCA